MVSGLVFFIGRSKTLIPIKKNNEMKTTMKWNRKKIIPLKSAVLWVIYCEMMLESFFHLLIHYLHSIKHDTCVWRFQILFIPSCKCYESAMEDGEKMEVKNKYYLWLNLLAFLCGRIQFTAVVYERLYFAFFRGLSFCFCNYYASVPEVRNDQIIQVVVINN